MSLWDTTPSYNFSDPHWQLICCNKWHPETSEISTPPEISCRSTLKLPWYLYLQVPSSYYQAGQCNQKVSTPVSTRWQTMSEKTKKDNYLWNRSLENYSKHSLFNKVLGPWHVASLKKKLWYRCFPVNFNKYLRILL